MESSFKALKEDFVSDLHGGTVGEINLILLVSLSGYALSSALGFHATQPSTWNMALVNDFIIQCLGLLAATTVYADHPMLLNALLLLPALVFGGRLRRSKTAAKKTKLPAGISERKDFVSVYRALMMVATCLAIFAVDFRVFPRRFAKVETWGTSLMDMGVGSFVFSAGLISTRSKMQNLPWIARCCSSLRQSAPLLVLGIVRVLLTKSTDYPEHVTEYGVHWNFFFTVGLLPFLSCLIDPVARLVPFYEVLALAVAACYEYFLSDTHDQFSALKTYILTSPRTDLISMNREGIFSLVGYFSIFLAGKAAGMHIFNPVNIRPRQILLRLGVSSVIWSVLYQVAVAWLGHQVSRRLANMPYMLWVSAANTAFLAGYLLVEMTIPSSGTSKVVKVSPLLRAVNRNGLAIFLLANVLTGLMNLSINSLDVGDRAAFMIISAYLATLMAVSVVLDQKNVTLRVT